jgi:hypothetical protein
VGARGASFDLHQAATRGRRPLGRDGLRRRPRRSGSPGWRSAALSRQGERPTRTASKGPLPGPSRERDRLRRSLPRLLTLARGPVFTSAEPTVRAIASAPDPPIGTGSDRSVVDNEAAPERRFREHRSRRWWRQNASGALGDNLSGLPTVGAVDARSFRRTLPLTVTRVIGCSPGQWDGSSQLARGGRSLIRGLLSVAFGTR